MAHKGNTAVRRVWQVRLQRFEECSLSVREFCERESVSQASFYQWRRRLKSDSGDVASKPTPSFQAVHVTATTGLSIVLPDGTRLELPAHQLELVRVVVRELTAHAKASEDKPC